MIYHHDIDGTRYITKPTDCGEIYGAAWVRTDTLDGNGNRIHAGSLATSSPVAIALVRQLNRERIDASDTRTAIAAYLIKRGDLVCELSDYVAKDPAYGVMAGGYAFAEIDRDRSDADAVALVEEIGAEDEVARYALDNQEAGR